MQQFRGPNEAAVAQRLWSLFAELRERSAGRSPAQSELARFAMTLGAQLNARIAYAPAWLFEGDYDLERAREYAVGEGLSLESPESEPARLIALWSRLAEGREHAPWSLIEAWDRSSDALAEVATALQPALSAQWATSGLEARALLVHRLDERQRVALREFARGPLVEYWCDVLSLDAPLRGALRAHVRRRSTLEGFESMASLREAIRATVARGQWRASEGLLETAVTRSIAVLAGVARLSFERANERAERAALWSRESLSAIEARADGGAVQSLEARVEPVIHCPELRATLEDARVKDAKRAKE